MAPRAVNSSVQWITALSYTVPDPDAIITCNRTEAELTRENIALSLLPPPPSMTVVAATRAPHTNRLRLNRVHDVVRENNAIVFNDAENWKKMSHGLMSHGTRCGSWMDVAGGRRTILLASHQGEPDSIPGRVTPGFSHVRLVSDDAAGRRVFSGISRLPCPFTPALLHTHMNHPRRLSRSRCELCRGLKTIWFVRSPNLSPIKLLRDETEHRLRAQVSRACGFLSGLSFRGAILFTQLLLLSGISSIPQDDRERQAHLSGRVEDFTPHEPPEPLFKFSMFHAEQCAITGTVTYRWSAPLTLASHPVREKRTREPLYDSGGSDFGRISGTESEPTRQSLQRDRRRSATSGREVCDCKYQAVKYAAGRLDYWTRCGFCNCKTAHNTNMQETEWHSYGSRSPLILNFVGIDNRRLKTAAIEEWDKLAREMNNDHVFGMPRQIQVCLRNRGGPTRPVSLYLPHNYRKKSHDEKKISPFVECIPTNVNENWNRPEKNAATNHRTYDEGFNEARDKKRKETLISIGKNFI
ncbi:hypothetical protein PR048_027543 [Dryococelus australis]|uniref:Uncharacterized protein n=1 Tax=Dryococelus australis TaxID=614101 RepID=A0ABQ9GGU5_9NEOP|nr:hypothetical protein PR048_027543 [Dryococelus australis]